MSGERAPGLRARPGEWRGEEGVPEGAGRGAPPAAGWGAGW